MNFPDRAQEIIASRDRLDDGERLHQLFTAAWHYTMTEFPEWATFVGYPGQNRRWTDQSLEALERRDRELEIPARVLESIDRARLSPRDQLHYDLFRRNVKENLDGRRFKAEYMPINQMQGIQQGLAQTIAMMPSSTPSDFEDVVARLEGIPRLVDQTIVLLRKGLETGLTPPRITLRDVPQQIRNQIVDEPALSPLLRPFFRAAGPAPAPPALREAAAEAYRAGVRPAFERLHEAFATEYLPRTRETIALRDLPDGEAWYAFNVRQQTTTDLAPSEIHRIGREEVQRIRGEMDRVVAGSGFAGDLHAFMHFLRTDPQFVFPDAQALLVAYRDIAKRADPELARLFGRLPRLPYGVVPVPAYAEKSQTTAYYEPGSPSAGRPGYFFANTYDLPSRPKWEMEALTLHEAVPGHHLQIALAQELEDLPEFRKHAFYTAYIEGWGLYAESLGTEMGFYADLHSRFGQLTYEMWRAIRLVVDTGIHALGWPREQALSYFEENAGKAQHDIVVEVDRYIVWPAQALAYKIGELKIKELRAHAARELGATFDLRQFHDQVLGEGAVPLDVLEQRLQAWVLAQRAGTGAGEPRPASTLA